MRFRTDPRDLAQIGLCPGALINLRDNMAVKIAVGTLGLTKRPVNIKPKAPVFPVFRQNNPQSV